MDSQKIVINKVELMFYSGLMLEFISNFMSELNFNSSLWDGLNSAIHLLSFLIITFAFISKKAYRKKELFCFFTFGLVGILNFYFSGSTTLLSLTLLVFASQGIDKNDIIKKMLILRVCMMIFLVLGLNFGVVHNIIDARTDIHKESLGFSHPNVLGLNLLAILTSVAYLMPKIKIRNTVIGGASLYVLFFVAGARTSIIAFLVFIILYIFWKLFKWQQVRKRYVRKLICNQYMILLISSILIGLLYNPYSRIMSLINLVLSRRLYLFHYYLKNTQLTLFGRQLLYQEQYWDGFSASLKATITLDNAYLYGLYCFGIIGTMLVIYFMNRALSQLCNDNNIIGIICMTSILVMGIAEIKSLDIHYNVFLFFSAELIGKNLRGKRESILRNKDHRIRG